MLYNGPDYSISLASATYIERQKKWARNSFSINYSLIVSSIVTQSNAGLAWLAWIVKGGVEVLNKFRKERRSIVDQDDGCPLFVSKISELLLLSLFLELYNDMIKN